MNNAVKKNNNGNMISNDLSENPVKPPNLSIYIYIYINNIYYIQFVIIYVHDLSIILHEYYLSIRLG